MRAIPLMDLFSFYDISRTKVANLFTLTCSQIPSYINYLQKSLAHLTVWQDNGKRRDKKWQKHGNQIALYKYLHSTY